MYIRRVDSLFSHLNDKSPCENCDERRVESCGRRFVQCIIDASQQFYFRREKRKKMNSLYHTNHTIRTHSDRQWKLTAP